MAPKCCCLIFYICFITLFYELRQIVAYEHVTYTAFNPPGEDSHVEYYAIDEVYSGVRSRRAAFTTEMPLEKPRPTKKPSGLDEKQATILSEGAGNKTGKPSLKENRVNGKILSVVDVFPNEDHNPVPAPPLLMSTTTTTEPTVLTSSERIQASGPVLLNVTIPPETDIKITRFLDDDIGTNALKEHNITKQAVDDHVYYNSTVYQNRGKEFWVDIDSMHGVKVSDILSQAHRRAVTVKLSFDFPFYGHLIRNMTIATGGFLYTGEYVHSWLAATQYIAPLMANFDTSLSNRSYVKYIDNGTAFTVQWENVVLQEMADRGSFTFQCTLLDTGDIIFVYKDVGVSVSDIEENQHPVKVGLSDAYIIDRTIFFVRRKTIYEYHRVVFERGNIQNWTVIMLRAQDTCLDMKTCQSCVSKLPKFQCNWCSGRCSNGMDRHRQDWLQRGCEAAELVKADKCPPSPLYDKQSSVDTSEEDDANVSIAGVVGILLTLSIVMCIAVWVTYAYRNPHTAAGQFLIRYRPTQWTWRRGEARYTAATIHM